MQKEEKEKEGRPNVFARSFGLKLFAKGPVDQGQFILNRCSFGKLHSCVVAG